jgi:RimJ/RimL family protein N-acetyltransferase
MDDVLPDTAVVRFATEADLETWQDVRLRSLADAPEAFGSTLERERAFADDDWKARLRPPAVLVMDGERAVGLGGGFEVRPGVILVVAMWLEPVWRGRGLSRRILDLVVDWARERGHEVELDVATDATAARAAYERYGFVYTGETSRLREGSSVVTHRMVLPQPPG